MVRSLLQLRTIFIKSSNRQSIKNQNTYDFQTCDERILSHHALPDLLNCDYLYIFQTIVHKSC